MSAGNQVSFKLTDASLLEQFKREAAKQSISIHEYGRRMAIHGHISLDSQSSLSTAAIKTSVTTLTTLRRLIKELPGLDNRTDQILAMAREDAQAILNTLGIEL
jgi:hypothetical protein